MLLCSTIASAEEEQFPEIGNTTAQEQTVTQEQTTESVQTIETPYVPMEPQYYAKENHGFDYHKWVDAIYVNFGIKSSHMYSLGFDIGNPFFLGYDYTWNAGNNDKTRGHQISLGIRPNIWMLDFLFFQCKIGAEFTFGTWHNVKNVSHIDALIEPRFGVKIGSGGVAASYRFDVDQFKFSNTITGHLCVTAFYYL